MIDTHAHLDFKDFDEDREEVIQRFFSQGGKAIINIGVDLERSRKSIDIAQSHDNIFASVGFHPHEAGENKSLPKESAFEEIETIAENKKVKAIGEIGLDYFYYKNKEQIELQKELFLRQIKIADDFEFAHRCPLPGRVGRSIRDNFRTEEKQVCFALLQRQPRRYVQNFWNCQTCFFHFPAILLIRNRKKERRN